ncbi:MAG: ankyrin repeat domain-containing protein [Bacteroidetes bacterium]|nr:ankyrin repeat domain-containing protein [Bacteroidota bacterium]
MENIDIADPLFREAVGYLDGGDMEALERLLAEHPDLVRLRADQPDEGYFKHPYLLWFVADNPIRRGVLASNIVGMARMIVEGVRKNAPELLKEQVGYALGLIATGRIPRECGVQLSLIDLMLDAGALPGEGLSAIAHGNPDAARHLISKGGRITLASAVGLGLEEEAAAMARKASREERSLALVVAAFHGRSSLLRLLIELGVDINAYPVEGSGFHTHATALHQAVWSGSLEAVQVLVEAGADVNATDRAYGGTPLGWALYAPQEMTDEVERAKYARIADYLKGRN